MKTQLTKTVFTLEAGAYRNEYSVIFEDSNVTVTYQNEVIFIQNYYNNPTQEAAIDILEAALLDSIGVKLL